MRTIIIKSLKHPVITAFLFIIASLVLYANSLYNDFIFDDNLLIINYKKIHTLTFSSLPDILINSYRPVRTVINAVLYNLFGFHAEGYRLFNLILHAVNGFMVFMILRKILGSHAISLAVALLFLVHPAHSDSVAYISGIRDTASAFFYLAGFWIYVLHREKSQPSLILLTLIFFVLAVLTKEMAITLPVLCILYDVCFYRRHNPDAEFPLKDMLRDNAVFYGSCLLLALSACYYYLFIRSGTGFPDSGRISWWSGSMLLNYLTIPRLITYYVSKTLIPTGLISDYSGYHILAESLSQIAVWTSLVAVAALIVFSIYAFRRDAYVSFGFWWFLITLMPVLHFIPHHELMATHYMYLPSIGCILAVCLLFYHLAVRLEKSLRTIMCTVILCAAVIFMGISTQARNRNLRNELVRAAHDLEYNPLSPRLHTVLGMIYEKSGLWESARLEYTHALKFSGYTYSRALVNMGVLLFKSGEYESANAHFYRALESGDPNAAANLALNLMKMDRKEEALEFFGSFYSKYPGRLSRRTARILYKLEMKRHSYANARKWARRLKDLSEESEVALLALARAQMLSLDLGSAVPVLEQLSRKNPEKYSVLIKQNSAYTAMIRKLDSLPDNEKEKNRLKTVARIRLELDDPQGALLMYEKARNAGAHFEDDDLLNIVRCMQNLDRIDEEYVGAVAELYDRNPENEAYAMMLVRAKTAMLEFDQAKQILKEKELIDSEDGSDIIKVVDRHRRHLEKAESDFDRSKDRGSFLIEKSKIFERLGNTHMAAKTLALAARFSSSSARAYWRLGMLYMDMGKLKEAFDSLSSALKIDAAMPEATLSMGRLHLSELGNYEGALRYLKKYLVLAPESPRSERIKQVIASLEKYRTAVLVKHDLSYKIELTGLGSP